VAVGVLQGRIGQRKPGFAILPMDDQGSGICMLPIYEKNDHLAIACLGSVVRAGTICMSQAGNMQVERSHDAKARTGQLLAGPCLDLFAGLIKGQKGN